MRPIHSDKSERPEPLSGSGPHIIDLKECLLFGFATFAHRFEAFLAAFGAVGGALH